MYQLLLIYRKVMTITTATRTITVTDDDHDQKDYNDGDDLSVINEF